MFQRCWEEEFMGGYITRDMFFTGGGSGSTMEGKTYLAFTSANSFYSRLYLKEFRRNRFGPQGKFHVLSSTPNFQLTAA